MKKRLKKKLARRMGFYHYADAKAVAYMTDVIMTASAALEESSWPTRSDITKLQVGFIDDMTKVYRHVLQTGQVPKNDKELMEVISNG